ncbi:MAG TPA: GNAT family N-acetyltransferase [Bosea sp. (in: a-proteobacteria)]|uniref:GNAT family N-acetyltransferase n=1 Tax=Bosea sp. (in: a-proteobacteria) TaxID=1871050 RepID=UPI002E139F6C|nr:GNAT family N-acetyltransferase [Bosea sp. (in: a-proteobacteria)]
MTEIINIKRFEEIDLDNPLFNSLKDQYKEFIEWFKKKAKENAYTINSEDGDLIGFVYLKIEDGSVDDVEPALPRARRLKVGTLKIEAHGTKLGERVIKKIFDHAFEEGASEIYVTVFAEHEGLIKLFERYGFEKKAQKRTENGVEEVLIRDLKTLNSDTSKNYPLIVTKTAKKYLLAIYPEYHTKLFPDSILKTEDPNIIEDVSYTNTIHKIYIAKLALTRLKPGDIVVIYRTTDIVGRARFRSVVTSVCVVEEVKSRKDFRNADEFVAFSLPHSVFSEPELRDLFASGGAIYAARMTYNAAFRKRTIRGTLLDDVGISEHPRWDLRELSDEQFQRIAELGKLNENLIVN